VCKSSDRQDRPVHDTGPGKDSHWSARAKHAGRESPLQTHEQGARRGGKRRCRSLCARPGAAPPLSCTGGRTVRRPAAGAVLLNRGRTTNPVCPVERRCGAFPHCEIVVDNVGLNHKSMFQCLWAELRHVRAHPTTPHRLRIRTNLGPPRMKRVGV